MSDARLRMLLHACCAPCSGPVIEQLVQEYQVTLYFYNPNIHPRDEYIQRRNELVRWAHRNPEVDIVIADDDSRTWFEIIRGYEQEPEKGLRCTICYGMRLEKSARYAAAHGYDIFTTTLSISPHKDAERINALGEDAASRSGVRFLQANFKKKGGFQRSLQISREMGFYRQHYCGCLYSMERR
ncbi:epoxyqueuosine reductase QueH [Desulfurispirillum indicum]|uniref:epoxyqueuosine reductase QueH n=1 Tax=Desulfurispirillum indicum TaxID=936456 RepID=UPI001CFB1AFE|nr:epoxyqueuosine reductase QueH [Desulfurispirillum indicum]UCZ55584.1 epoxyqueuosine reductase QueH [Desulfurispirillum indicum]